ncbi:translation initiation factor eIF-1A [archaeon CG_4_10_14_0_2_um_filter_Archaea_38_6]|nr:MAG: translation initiation factor eIF-1A [archaeon CG07_land_8_20_14_0_80_38_8]PIU89233.1 MAG: translation initiation factor eIF-1A [archaeon CG06_land_8_20_14_3_00_37_11]PJA22496.1 MAG: translation initiation factor eIF-1A [archaeon CG_4_10_14_0_2_um_filter_Archaea_38_6]
MADDFEEDFKDDFEPEDEKPKLQEGEEVIRVRMPKGKEVLGIVEQLLGLRKMYVRCLDGKTRLCRVPGRLRRSMWVRQGDVVIIEPWEYEEDRGDIIFDYRKSQVDWLRRKGMLKDLEEF